MAGEQEGDERVLYTCPCAVEYTRCRGGGSEGAPGERETLRGQLVVTAQRVLVRSDTATAALPAREIFLSAISRDAAEPHPCIYCQCAPAAPAADDDAEADADEPFDEVRLAPEDAACLEALHRAVCDAVALNPLPDDALSDDEDEDGEEEWHGPAPCLPRLDFADAANDTTREIGAPHELPAKVTRSSGDPSA